MFRFGLRGKVMDANRQNVAVRNFFDSEQKKGLM